MEPSSQTPMFMSSVSASRYVLFVWLDFEFVLCVSHLSLWDVSELPPQILTDDGNTYAYTEGQKALLECETFGSPKPKVIWWGGVAYSTVLADFPIKTF